MGDHPLFFWSVRGLLVLACLFLTGSVFTFAATEPVSIPPENPDAAEKIAGLIDRLDDDRLAVRNAAEAALTALSESEADLLPDESALDFGGERSAEATARLKNVYQNRLRETARRSVAAFTFKLLEPRANAASPERFWVTLRVGWNESVVPVCLEFPMNTFSATLGPEDDGKTLFPTVRETTLDLSPTEEQRSGDLPFSLEGTRPDVSPDADAALTLRGTCRLLLAMRPKEFVFRRPLNRRDSRSTQRSPSEVAEATGARPRTGRSIRQGSAMVAVESVRLAPPEAGATSQNLVIRVALDYDRAHGALQSHRTWIYDCPAFLRTADNRRIEPYACTPTRYVPNGISLAFSFAIPLDTEIEEFVYAVPTIITSETVPVVARVEKSE